MESRRENRYRPSALRQVVALQRKPENRTLPKNFIGWNNSRQKTSRPFCLSTRQIVRKNTASLAIRIKETFGSQPIPVSAKEKTGIELIRQAILEKLPEDFDQQSITGNLVTEGDLVLLVMPQDIQAPKGGLFATSADNAGIARQEMSDHELHHR